jgi:hypothetical protein
MERQIFVRRLRHKAPLLVEGCGKVKSPQGHIGRRNRDLISDS